MRNSNRFNKCFKLWNDLNDAIFRENELGEETLDEQTVIIENLEKLLPFENKEQHEKWLDVLFGYKFWEDFEQLTLSIMYQCK